MTEREVACRSDPELVARMARGDRHALAALYERHAPRLTVVARHILDQSEAEDVLHDVFLEVWRHAGDYVEARGSVWAWLSTRTRSRALDRRRALPGRFRVELDFSKLETLVFAAAEPSEALGDRGRLREALAQMSNEEQIVLWLGYFEGLSSSEIAERIAAPIGTVKSRTRSALAKLRDWFGAEGRHS
jgi:RNA polymerase sigma-70 factor, ECF subfamily